MATVTGLTAARMIAMEAATIISGVVSGNDLILTKRDGTTLNAGNVRGLTGLTPVLRGLSVTSQAIATGSKTFAISPAMNVAFPVGATVKAQGAAAGDYMVGLVTAASTTSVTINVSEISGTGTFASWTLLIGSFRGTDGVLTGTAGGDLAGTYPNPTIGLLKVLTGHIANLAVTDGKVATANKDGLATVPSMRTLGAGPLQAAAGDHTHAERPSVFMARTAAVAQSIPTTSYTRILLPDGLLEGIDYDAATGIFTVVTPGVYELFPMIGFASAAAGRRILTIYINGVEECRQENAASTTIHSMSFSTAHRFVAGDTFEMRGWQNTGGAINTAVVGGQIRFAATRTGP